MSRNPKPQPKLRAVQQSVRACLKEAPQALTTLKGIFEKRRNAFQLLKSKGDMTPAKHFIGWTDEWENIYPIIRRQTVEGSRPTTGQMVAELIDLETKIFFIRFFSSTSEMGLNLTEVGGDQTPEMQGLEDVALRTYDLLEMYGFSISNDGISLMDDRGVEMSNYYIELVGQFLNKIQDLPDGEHMHATAEENAALLDVLSALNVKWLAERTEGIHRMFIHQHESPFLN